MENIQTHSESEKEMNVAKREAERATFGGQSEEATKLQ